MNFILLIISIVLFLIFVFTVQVENKNHIIDELYYLKVLKCKLNKKTLNINVN